MRAAAGFTLVELLVTISIIALLIGVTSVGVTTALRVSHRNHVKAMFESLHGAQTQYQSATQSKVNHVGTSPVDWSDNFAMNSPGPPAPGSAAGTTLSSSERFVVACLQLPASADAVKAATNAPGTYTDADKNGFMEIRDSWDTPILYFAFNGPVTDAAYDARFPLSRDPFFVSAGPDADFDTDDDITSIDIGD